MQLVNNVIVPVQRTLEVGDYYDILTVNTLYVNPVTNTSSFRMDFYNAEGSQVASTGIYNIIVNLTGEKVSSLSKCRITCLAGQTQIFLM